jgi:hypothetical protein
MKSIVLIPLAMMLSTVALADSYTGTNSHGAPCSASIAVSATTFSLTIDGETATTYLSEAQVQADNSDSYQTTDNSQWLNIATSGSAMTAAKILGSDNKTVVKDCLNLKPQ